MCSRLTRIVCTFTFLDSIFGWHLWNFIFRFKKVQLLVVILGIFFKFTLAHQRPKVLQILLFCVFNTFFNLLCLLRSIYCIRLINNIISQLVYIIKIIFITNCFFKLTNPFCPLSFHVLHYILNLNYFIAMVFFVRFH